MQILPYVFTVVAAYLIGAIPTGYLIARFHGDVDLLRQGSGRTGTTNVLRTLGWRAAGAVFLGDVGKGMVAVAAGRLLAQGDPLADLLAGLAVIAGHAYSPFLGFKGGRGVATGFGTLLVIAPAAGLLSFAVMLSVSALTRYASLGSILGSGVALLTVLVLTLALGQPIPHLVYTLAGSAFIVAAHRDNIVRLLRGTERKIGESARP